MESLEINNVNQEFWNGKKVFLTGNTGFKGSWLSLWLVSLGAIVKGYSLKPNTNPSLFEILHLNDIVETNFDDIRNLSSLKKSLSLFQPDIIIHLAAQPLVRESYKDPIDTFTTNIIGTANILEASRFCDSVRAILIVTTDKVYENKEWCWGYKEGDVLGGYDPYSSSKACAEIITSTYLQSFFSNNDSPSIATARAGNVIGGGDWSCDRLIPDAIKAFENGEKVIIRNPNSTRPWQHVIEPLSGYLMLVEAMYSDKDKFSGSWNFGPNDSSNKSVRWMMDRLVDLWGKNAEWQYDHSRNPHEANFLKLDCSKAKTFLKWHPRWEIESVLEKIYNWNQEFKNGANMNKYCMAEINSYFK